MIGSGGAGNSNGRDDEEGTNTGGRAQERREHRLKGKILARRKNEEERNRKADDETKRKAEDEKREKMTADIIALGYPEWRRREVEGNEREEWKENCGDDEWTEEKERRRKEEKAETEKEMLNDKNETKARMVEWLEAERMCM